jgi:hypothetical protein
MRSKVRGLSTLILIVLIGSISAGGGPAGVVTTQEIISEGQSHSELMKNFEYMSDMIGPRLTGSKKFKRAAEWMASRFRDYGLTNVHLETWDF